MKFGTMAAMSALTFALAACGDNTSNTSNTSATTNGTTMLPDTMNGTMMGDNATAPVSGNQEFVNKAAASDAFEIASSKLATEKATSAKIKDFAAQMIKAHEESTAKLKTAAATQDPAIVPDATLNAEQQAAIDDLRSKTGADFDQAYAAAQVEAHEDALELLKDYAEDGPAPQLKAFASDLAPKVAAHLNMALGLK